MSTVRDPPRPELDQARRPRFAAMCPYKRDIDQANVGPEHE
jgi:hypothetical protein